MIFQIFQIRNNIKEVRANPGDFASEQARDVILGILIVPILIVIIGLVFLFALGFLHFLGGPYLIFRIVFFIGLLVSFIFGSIVYKITSLTRKTTKKVVNYTVEEVKNIKSLN